MFYFKKERKTKGEKATQMQLLHWMPNESFHYVVMYEKNDVGTLKE